MFQNLLKVSAVLMIGMISVLISCNKEEVETPEFVENFTDQAVFEMQARGNCGKFGCFEFVFPIDIVFADASEAEVNSYEELRDAIMTWKEANPEESQRPTFTFPIEVVSEDGDVISVANESELMELRRACRKTFFERHHHRGHMARGTHCFSLVFPVTVSFPDGTSVPAEDHQALKNLLREWKDANRESSERPELVFPLKVQMEDETVVDVANKEALHDLKSSCGEG